MRLPQKCDQRLTTGNDLPYSDQAILVPVSAPPQGCPILTNRLHWC